MIDKKVRQDIKAVQAFLEFWGRFHSIYDTTIRKERITNEDEVKFLETKELIRAKYEELTSALELRYAPRTRLTDPVSDILAMHGIRFMAEKNLKKANDDWKDSYVFLNSILERLKDRERRLDEFNPVGVFLKRMFRRG
jgi:hypothetical protein